MFDTSVSTREVFNSVAKGLVRSVLSGYNSTIFAYGQTASGKTHTMQGSRDNPGVIPLAVQEIMAAIGEVRGWMAGWWWWW